MTVISKEIFDPKECFLKWHELGDTIRVAKWMASQGKISPLTGKPFSRNSIYVAAMTFAMDNIEFAKSIFKQHGVTKTEDEWDRWFIKRALRYKCSSKKVYIQWLKDNEYWDVEKYKNIYAKRLGIRNDR
jgi:hypothetical protein